VAKELEKAPDDAKVIFEKLIAFLEELQDHQFEEREENKRTGER
jgi:hypothetical protein